MHDMKYTSQPKTAEGGISSGQSRANSSTYQSEQVKGNSESLLMINFKTQRHQSGSINWFRLVIYTAFTDYSYHS